MMMASADAPKASLATEVRCIDTVTSQVRRVENAVRELDDLCYSLIGERFIKGETLVDASDQAISEVSVKEKMRRATQDLIAIHTHIREFIKMASSL